MAPKSKPKKDAPAGYRPVVLVVDDEPEMLELAADTVGRLLDCRLVTAADCEEAERVINSEPVDMMLTDVNLPDGDGISLVSALHAQRPHAEAVVITGDPTVTRAITAMRAGVMDFLPKPFGSELLVERVRCALVRHAARAAETQRMERLKKAVKHLKQARKVVSQKVDILCNDLVAAYGELSKQFDEARTQDNFRKLISTAKDLEQLLCHAMDFILRTAGHCNVAVWLASEENEYELGAYMKYTIAGSPEVTEAIKAGLLRQTIRQGFLNLDGEELTKQLTIAELELMENQSVMAISCSYLGEPLAAVICFRDSKSPFTEADAATLKAIAPLFATTLAEAVRGYDAKDDEEAADFEPFDADDMMPGAFDEDEKPKKKPKGKEAKSDADWWKRGEAPPF